MLRVVERSGKATLLLSRVTLALHLSSFCDMRAFKISMHTFAFCVVTFVVCYLCIALSFVSFRCIWATTKFKTKHPEVIDIIDNATREDDSKWTFNSGTRTAFIKTYEDSKSTRPAFLVCCIPRKILWHAPRPSAVSDPK